MLHLRLVLPVSWLVRRHHRPEVAGRSEGRGWQSLGTSPWCKWGMSSLNVAQRLGVTWCTRPGCDFPGPEPSTCSNHQWIEPGLNVPHREGWFSSLRQLQSPPSPSESPSRQQPHGRPTLLLSVGREEGGAATPPHFRSPHVSVCSTHAQPLLSSLSTFLSSSAWLCQISNLTLFPNFALVLHKFCLFHRLFLPVFLVLSFSNICHPLI